MAKISIPQIAKLAGVSIGTVDRALNDRAGINPQTREKILRIAAEHDYRPNKLSKALAKNKKITLGVLTLPTQSPFTQDLIAAAQAAAAELADYGVNVNIVSLTEIRAELAVNAICQFMRKGCDGIAIEGIDNPAVVDAVDAAVDGGIPVVTFNTDLPDSRRLCYVGQDCFKSGKVAADLLCRFMGGRGEVLILHGSAKVPSHQARVDGFCEVVASDFPQIHIAAIRETIDNEENAYRLTLSYLSENPKVTGIYVAATGSRGAADALLKLKKADTVSLVCNDIVPKTLEYLEKGVIDATILQNPEQQGARPIQILFDYIFDGKKPENILNYTQIDVLTKSGIR